MARGDRVAVTVPQAARIWTRLASLLASMVQEGQKLTDMLDVALMALLVGLRALELARSPEGTPDGIRKLIREALNPDAAAPRVELDPDAPKPEKPHERAWRTWRTAYLRAYARPYVTGTACGPAMMRYAKLAVSQCVQMDHDDDADLERLLDHWWRKYLADPGYSKGLGDPGYLRGTSHALPGFARSVQNYGTPWDGEVKKITRPALAPAPATPRQLAARKPGQAELFGAADGARAVAQATKGGRAS